MSLQPLDVGATVFRLVRNIPDHHPPNAPKPLPGAFKLTRPDFEDGRVRGIPPLYSVFNAARTAIEQARQLRGQRAEDSTPYCWTVNAIAAIQGFDGAMLRVLCDPDRWSKGPGSRGHCGVAGFVRGYDEPAGADKLVVKKIRSAMIDSCERFDPARHPSPWMVVQMFDCVATRVARTLTKNEGD